MTPPRTITLIVSLRDVIEYLTQQLLHVEVREIEKSTPAAKHRIYGIDTDAVASIVHLLAMTDLNVDDEWGDVNSYEQAVDSMTRCFLITEDEAADLCRTTTRLVGAAISQQVPDFGSANYKGRITHDFVSSDAVRITISAGPAI